jgi:hypothetical protein
MNQLKDLPDLARPFERLKLEELLWKANHLSVYGSAIHGLLTIKKPMTTICEFILQMDADDHKEMIFAIGQETLDRVKKYYYTKGG